MKIWGCGLGLKMAESWHGFIGPKVWRDVGGQSGKDPEGGGPGGGVAPQGQPVGGGGFGDERGDGRAVEDGAGVVQGPQ